MIPAMKILTMLVCVPLLAAFTACPAQKGDEQGDKKPKKIEDSKFTKEDPAIRAIDKFIKAQSVDTKSSSWKAELKEPPKQEFQANMDYVWNVETSAGELIRFRSKGRRKTAVERRRFERDEKEVEGCTKNLIKR